MRVKILGSAAGGGFPQWNCACPNCRAVRAGTFPGKARTQTQVAISANCCSWFLLGASPDLRTQIEASPELHPRESVNEIRQSPIVGVVLANADVDHALGLLLLRELQRLRVYGTLSVHRILTEDNSMFKMLQRVPNQVAWNDFETETDFALLDPVGPDCGLRCRALSLGRHSPAYVSDRQIAHVSRHEGSMALFIASPSGKCLAYFPAVPQIDDTLLDELESIDLLLFDGTFWSDDELIQVQGSGQTAKQMGHVPVSSHEGSLSRLAQLRHPRKIYIHVNNTNPMLNEAGPEYARVREAGWEIAEDGWAFDL